MDLNYSIPVSNLGKWDPWYSQLAEDADPEPYGYSEAYRLGAEWLAGCSPVEDWGCGRGWLRTLIPPEDRYVGLDGTASPFTDLVVDLAEYTSQVPGIFMRGVIEHDYRWQSILANALTSFTECMVLVLFTPMSETDTHEIAWVEEIGVPDISFSMADIVELMLGQGLHWICHEIKTPGSGYGVETIFKIWREDGNGTHH